MNAIIFLGMIGPWQIAIIVFAIILLFGGKKIPELMKGIGEGMKEFKKASNTEKEADKEEGKDKPKEETK